jgi:hypothetical protein
MGQEEIHGTIGQPMGSGQPLVMILAAVLVLLERIQVEARFAASGLGDLVYRDIEPGPQPIGVWIDAAWDGGHEKCLK